MSALKTANHNWRQAKDSKEYIEAQSKFAANLLKYSGICTSIKTVSSNPGIMARYILNTSNRENVFSVVPDCNHKRDLMLAMAKFDKLRAVYKNRCPSTEMINEYTANAQDFYNHMKMKMKWFSFTDLLHVLVAHVPEYFDNPNGTGSLIDMSSSGLELGNKAVRHGIFRKAFKGNVQRQMDDVLKDAFHRGTFPFRNFDKTHRLEKHCSNCGRSGHYIKSCDIQRQEEQHDEFEEVGEGDTIQEEEDTDEEDSDLEINHPQAHFDPESEESSAEEED